MGKVLVMSVGVGGNNKESLANALKYSIQHHNPEKVIFLVSEQSKNEVLPLIVEDMDSEYETIDVSDINDIDKLYEKFVTIFSLLLKRGYKHKDIVVDFTSGTKAMSAALAIASISMEIENLSYIMGDRKDGTVISGRERILPLRPYSILIDNQLKIIDTLFSFYRFDACIDIINTLKRKTNADDIQSILNKYENICLAYSLWDKFDHSSAQEKLKDVKNILRKNYGFLGRLNALKKNEENDVFEYLIADLINNAKRRGKEGRYDDAVARLYRAVEMVAQYRLKSLGFDTSDIDMRKIPEKHKEKYNQLKDKKTGKIKLPLYKSYELLSDIDDEIGKKFYENEELQKYLRVRNDSVLAHGITPITQELYEKLLKATIDFIKDVFPDIENLMRISEFPSSIPIERYKKEI